MLTATGTARWCFTEEAIIIIIRINDASTSRVYGSMHTYTLLELTIILKITDTYDDSGDEPMTDELYSSS